MAKHKLGLDFYNRTDVIQVSRELLGKVLVTQLDGHYTAGIITETEAYAGVADKASHAYGNRHTNRTAVMFGPPGRAYVYLCYGIHHLFNVVTNEEGIPHAVLIRAVWPIAGIEQVLLRRKQSRLTRKTCGGPGTLAQGLGIHTKQTGTDLLGDAIWIEDQGIRVLPDDIIIGPRIGVDYAEEDALLPYRFVLSTNHYIYGTSTRN